MNIFQLVEEMCVDQGKEGQIRIHKDGTSPEGNIPCP
jgi:hypothetical protein